MIFHSYVSLPEGIPIMFEENVGHPKLLASTCQDGSIASVGIRGEYYGQCTKHSFSQNLVHIAIYCNTIYILYINTIYYIYIYYNYILIFNIHILWARKLLAATSALWTSVEFFGSECADRSSVSRSCSAEDGQRLERCRLCFSASTCRNLPSFATKTTLEILRPSKSSSKVSPEGRRYLRLPQPKPAGQWHRARRKCNIWHSTHSTWQLHVASHSFT